jgi:hypothetical protein
MARLSAAGILLPLSLQVLKPPRNSADFNCDVKFVCVEVYRENRFFDSAFVRHTTSGNQHSAIVFDWQFGLQTFEKQLVV